MNKETSTRHKKVCIVSEVNAKVRPFFLAFVATQRELVDDGDLEVEAIRLQNTIKHRQAHLFSFHTVE